MGSGFPDRIYSDSGTDGGRMGIHPPDFTDCHYKRDNNHLSGDIFWRQDLVL